MRINLLYPDKETTGSVIYPDFHEIVKDLNLSLIFEQASRDTGKDDVPTKDEFIRDAMRKVMSVPMTDAAEVRYRQGIVRSAIDCADFCEELYALATEADNELSEHTKNGNKNAGGGAVLEKGRMLRAVLGFCSRLKALVNGGGVNGALREAFESLLLEYNDDFESAAADILRALEFTTEDSVISFAAMDIKGLKSSYFVPERVMLSGGRAKRRSSAAFGKLGKLAGAVFNPDVREYENELEIEETKALEDAAAAYILSFFSDFVKEAVQSFRNLKLQAAFLVGCIRLYKRFVRFNVPLCFPEVSGREELSFTDLCETCLCIYLRKRPVPNSLEARDKQVLIVTGANQGGKSTYLRSIGIAQIFMQTGMFVTASAYRSGLYKNIFTHFTRREDQTMNSGRLDEESKRMSRIVSRLSSDSMLLLNESFATTTEKEGSVIAYELTDAILKTEVRMLSVTHLLEFAHRLYADKRENVLFLSAGRLPDGRRSYRISENAPEDTSYGLDLYDELINV